MSEARRLCNVGDEVRGIGLSIQMDDGHLVFMKENWQDVTEKEWSALRYVTGNLHRDDVIELEGALWGEGFYLKLRKLPLDDYGHIPFKDTWSVDVSYGMISIQTSVTTLNPFEIPLNDESDTRSIGGFSFRVIGGETE